MLLRNAALGRHWITTSSLLLSNIILVGESLLVLEGLRHVVGMHISLLWHAGSVRSWDVLGRLLLGGVNCILIINSILSVASRFRGIQTGLDQVLSFCLRNKRLKLWRSEGIDKTSFGDNEEEDLSSSEDRQFVCLLHDTGLPLGEGNVATRLIRDELDLNLSALASWLIIIIVVVVGSGWALALDTAILSRN